MEAAAGLGRGMAGLAGAEGGDARPCLAAAEGVGKGGKDKATILRAAEEAVEVLGDLLGASQLALERCRGPWDSGPVS